jgi:hypothetical protein
MSSEETVAVAIMMELIIFSFHSLFDLSMAITLFLGK